MKKTYYIIGWESNDSWRYTHDFYCGENDGILKTNIDKDNAITFETEDHAISKLNYLRESFNDIGWYILIEYD